MRLGKRRRETESSDEPEEEGSAGSSGEASGNGSSASILLLRCPTPTNFLCPCGAVERRLRKLELDHRVDRVPYKRRGARPEVVELTGQSRVPVLIDGDEVIHDSKRILEYLQWRYGDAEDAGKKGDAGDVEKGSDEEE